jgi:hypothetical protein
MDAMSGAVWPSEERAAAYWQAEDWRAEMAMDDCPHEGSVCDCDEEAVS